MSSTSIKCVTIAHSHYCECSRWMLQLLNQSSSMASTILTRLEQSIQSYLAKSNSLDYNHVYQEFADGFSALIEGFSVDLSQVKTVQ